MAMYAQDIDVSRKPDHSPVTEADRASEEVILRHLAKIAPNIPVVAEESVAAGSMPHIVDLFFLVDPLDGTREFISRNGEFTVNIALVEQGLPVAGVVLAPAIGRLFATDSEGAYQATLDTRDIAGSLPLAQQRELHCRGPRSSRLRAVASRSHRDNETDAYLARHNITDTISAGSSLKFCLLAAGEADVYPRFGPTMQWDTAAGHAVLRAAGGEVYRADGEILRYGGSELRNPPFIAWRDATTMPPL